MDLRLFHPTDDPTKKYKRLDSYNSRTGAFACRLLEFIGWYNSDVKLRLLGHYRLYQIYTRRRVNSSSSRPAIQGYIFQYRSSFAIKYYWNLILSRLPSLFGTDPHMEMYWINRILINERVDVLGQFLANADTNFEQAFKTALLQMDDPAFINKAVEKETLIKETVMKESVIKEIIPKKDLGGKEKDVFSKHQVLIIFDLLAESERLDRLDLRKTHKHPQIARFLQALSGRGKDTWMETLQDYRNNDLYAFNTPEECTHLLATLKNIATIAQDAGLRSICSLAEMKMRKIKAGK